MLKMTTILRRLSKVVAKVCPVFDYLNFYPFLYTTFR